jgi:radical SAM superfamily enzyme YgiQ (UPF0313 family)
MRVLARYVDNDTIVIGAQSGSDRVLRAMRRGHTVADVERAVRIARAHGFIPDLDFLWGMPGESREEREASIRLAERLVGEGARIHAHAFMPLPGTPLRDAEPTAIEDDVAFRMSRLESSGAMHGQWRRQVIAAKDLVRRRAGV